MIRDSISPTTLKRFSTSSRTSPATDMREKIIFTDYYRASVVGQFPAPVQVIDPVNAKNNVASLYTATQADAIVEAALEAGDAIDAALAAPTKQETAYYWRKVFGPSFQV